jgi:hypothetical protein
MKEKIFAKNPKKGGEKMMKRILILTMALVFGATALCFAASSKTINVTAAVPLQSGGLNVSVSKIRSTDDAWVQTGDIPVDFGTLTYNTTYGIFLPTYYYAVDVGVIDNSGTAWTLTHTRASVKKDSTNNLDSSINVTFVKQVGTGTPTELKKVTFANSNNTAYTKANLTGGWLRIYYGIAAGDPKKPDASGAELITMDKPYGTYAGTVTITLTP